jgi:hypothetical protein
MATKRQRRKRRRRVEGVSAESAPPDPPVQDPAAAVGATPSARRTDGPPPAPWGSFPLSELVVVVAIVFLVAGFFVAPPRGAVMIGAGLVLGSLAGLELAVREHFAGYRSHTLLLAGAIGVAVVAALYVSGAVVAGIALLAGIAAFGAFGWLFASAFRRRSGGALFRFKGGR